MNDIGNSDVNFDLLMLELREKLEVIDKELACDPVRRLTCTIIDQVMWEIIKHTCARMGIDPTSRDFAKAWVTAITAFTAVADAMPPLFMVADGKPTPVSLQIIVADLARVVFAKYEERS